MASTGTDSGGSIRGPAATCGVVGLKPTYSRVSCKGVIALSHSLDTVDLIVVPTLPSTPGGRCRREPTDPKVARRGMAYNAPFNLTGSPALSLPCGFNSAGLPVGVQLVGRGFDEATVLAAARQHQLATDWRRRRPPLI